MLRLGIWSSEYFQITGQALVTRAVVERILPVLCRHREYIYRPAGGLGSIASWFVAWGRLWKDLAFRRVDTLYLVCSRSNVGFVRDIPALLAARYGARVVVHVHGSDIVDLLTARWLSPLARNLYGRCELVVPSQHLVEKLEGKVAALHVCENFSFATLPGSIDSKRAGAMPLVVLWNSNIMASKGAFDVFEAVRMLIADGAAITLRVIGSVMGDDELSGTAAAARLNLLARNGSLNYLGLVSAQYAAELVNEADVVALPSSGECQPLAILQAMCAGKAIVVSDLPALRSTLGSYPAEFVPIHSVESLLTAMRRLYDEKVADPNGFIARRAGPACAANERFAAARFDREMLAVLSGNPNKAASRD